MSRYPELPPGYVYEQQNQRIFVSYLQNGLRRRLRVSHSVREQYWHQHVNAALAAWKHAYEQLKEEVR